jgi:hypothetical protein
MKMTCPICDTDNRGHAKFCIECLNPLPPALATPGFARKDCALPEPTRRNPSRPDSAEIHEANKGVWFSIAGLVLALTVGSAAGWMLSGPGAVYKAEPEANSAQPRAMAGAPVLKPIVRAPRGEVAKPVAASRPSQRSHEAVEPGAACVDLNFISAARCMAAQCLKPAFKPHAQCEAVHRQLRIEEEKRNPILAN